MFPLDFEGALVDRVWPAERVVLGLRVSKAIRKQLLCEAQTIVFARSHFSPRPHDCAIPEVSIAQCLKQFRGKMRVHVRLNGCSALSSELLYGLSRDAEQEFLGRLATLDLGLMFPRTRDLRLADALKSCVNLAYLNLSSWKIGNDIEVFCTALARCTNLTNLNLCNTGVGGDDADITIASSLRSLPQLSSLSLSHNSLSGRPLIESCSALTFLDLSGNVPRRFEQRVLSGPHQVACRGLESLHLGSARLAAREALHLSAVIQQCAGLRALDVSNNELQLEGCLVVLAAIHDAGVGLASLNLENNGLGRDTPSRVVWEACMQHLACIPPLSDICFNRNPIPPPGCQSLLSAAGFHRALRRLGLQSAELGEEAMLAFADKARVLEQLEQLELGLNPKIAVGGAKALGRAVQHWTRLTRLGVQGNLMQAEGVQALVCGLEACAALQSLDASDNLAGADGATRLCSALQRWPELETLSMSGNALGDEGVAALGAGLARDGTALRTLALGSNGFGAQGVCALAAALPQLPRLAHLRLDNTRAKQAGAEAIAEHISSCRQLTILDMSNCRLAEQGCAAVLEGVRGCRALRKLDLGGNAMGIAGQSSTATAAMDLLPDHVRVSPMRSAPR